MNITRCVIIALDVLSVVDLQEGVLQHMTPNVSVMQAINGTEAMWLTKDTLPLYTRFLIQNGRQNHVQIGNSAMIGCLLSHIKVWRDIQPGETVMVVEEDAVVDTVSAVRLAQVVVDIGGDPWDVIRLDAGQLIDTGESVYLGSGMVARCAHGKSCVRFGTRGYLLNFKAAQVLLRYSTPVIMQVDALLSIVATYTPWEDFRLYWATANVVSASHFRRSTVYDWCVVQCFLHEWIMVLAIAPLAVFTVCRIKHISKRGLF